MVPKEIKQSYFCPLQVVYRIIAIFCVKSEKTNVYNQNDSLVGRAKSYFDKQYTSGCINDK